MRDEIIAQLQEQANLQNAEGMTRFGIRGAQVLGVSIPTLHKMAKTTGKNHALALELWATGIHEVIILALMIDELRLVSSQQMGAWVSDFDSWDLCDQDCGNLFVKTPYTYEKAMAWCQREEEFVPCFELIKQYAVDDRNFVKKAVNWAWRQIGKRNSHLLALAQECAYVLCGNSRPGMAQQRR